MEEWLQRFLEASMKGSSWESCGVAPGAPCHLPRASMKGSSWESCGGRAAGLRGGTTGAQVVA